ncbi:DNA-binding transcriptional regulator, MarR family [Candidatus Methylocalor cossyra]|uniref:DNA-binding transcriptional regulator, MarR family n=2 Tax=Candidatus Methylocalor cossyra TaxID=3108543 RepID=A0ABM9NG19_9GAMM
MNAVEIYEYLERIANLLRTDVRRTGLASGLQPVQMEALHYLGRCNHYSNTPVAVAEFLGLTKGTVSQTLGVLEGNRLIEKEADAKDRRVVHLRLTAEGERLLAESIPPQVLKAAAAAWSEAEARAVADALERFLRQLQWANGLKTFGACRTCRHHRREADGSRWCGLTSEPLTESDALKICREHAPAGEPEPVP